MALGSTRIGVFHLFMSSAARQVVIGLGIGLAGAWAASATMRSMVYGISTRSPLLLTAAVAVIVCVAFLVIIVPVLRATRVSPIQVLRIE